MRNPPPELIRLVRRNARAWAYRRGYPNDEHDDIEGDALEWLCRYEPPEGWDPTGATLWKLPRILASREKDLTRKRCPTVSMSADSPTVEDGYAEVEVNDFLDGLEPFDRAALLAGLEYGGSAVLARRAGCSEAWVTRRRKTARALARDLWRH